VLGLVGTFITVARFGFLIGIFPTDIVDPGAPIGPFQLGPILIAKQIISLTTKVVLVAAGVLLLMRSRLATISMVCLIVLSTADSLAIFFWILPPVPDDLTNADQAGESMGRWLPLVLPPVLYLITIWYLWRPKTRIEFMHGITRVG